MICISPAAPRFPRLLSLALACLVAFLAFAPSRPALAAIETGADWTARVAPSAATPGTTVTLTLTATIKAPWHIYDQTLPGKGPVATRITLRAPAGWSAPALWTASKPPVTKFDPNFNSDMRLFDGVVEFSAPVLIPPGTAPGDVETTGTVRFQACTDEQCLPPRAVKWGAKLTILPGGAAAAAPVPPPAATSVPPPADTPAAAAAPAPSTDEAAELRKQGIGTFLLFAAAAGFVSLLTPCVFPMVPITISFFTKRAQKAGTPRKGVALAFIYALGIVVTYSVLGLLLSLILGSVKGASGAGGPQWIAANPWVNLVLASLFVVFALSLLGLFDLQLPPSIANKLQGSAGGRSDAIGALVMAIVFTVTSFTCTVQFVGSLLVLAARGDVLWPALGMIVYSSAFASPFFLLALFPQMIARVPRSGPWLHSTKVVMGFLEIAAALKFISNTDLVWQWGIFTREFVLAGWVAIALFTGLYLLGKIPVAGEEKTESIGAGRLLFSLFMITSGLYLASGLAGNRLHGLVETYLPPVIEKSAGAGGASGAASATRGPAIDSLPWGDNLKTALDTAKQRNVPVFIDFTGYTCTNCRWMEINILSRPEMIAELEKFALVKLYTDGGPDGDANQALQAERFDTVALPLYVILRPDGTTIATTTTTRDPKVFLKFLQDGFATVAGAPGV